MSIDPSFAFKTTPDEENPFSKMDEASWELAQSICAGLRSFAFQLAPLLDGKCVIVLPDGTLKVADLVLLQVKNDAPRARANA